jgi:hypothetical protein
MKTTEIQRKVAAQRRRCRKWADELGCTIRIDRVGFGREMLLTYRVYGPDIYAEDAEGWRDDPRDGNHAAAGWDEVEGILEDYALDLAFHRLGIDTNRTQAIQSACKGEAWKLMEEWVSGSTECGLFLADWLDEAGRGELAYTVRGIITGCWKSGQAERVKEVIAGLKVKADN